MKNVLKNGFNIDSTFEVFNNVKNLPLAYVSDRELYKYNVDGFEFLLVYKKMDNRFSSIQLKRQLEIYYKKTNMVAAFVFDNVSKKQRDGLIKNNVPFIVDGKQMYLPFLGMILTNSFEEKIQREKFMPITQLVFLYMLYNCKTESIIKGDIAKKLNTTRTSIKRATDELINDGLMIENKIGVCSYVKLVDDIDIKNVIKNYFINPVQKKFYVKKSNLNYLYSGEYGLAVRSMLGEPSVVTCAIYKNDFDFNEFEIVDELWGNDIIEIELWKYNPTLICDENGVDDLSLVKSLEEVFDERVENEIEKVLSRYANWNGKI